MWGLSIDRPTAGPVSHLVNIMTSDREPVVRTLSRDELVSNLVVVTREMKEFRDLRGRIVTLAEGGASRLLLIEALDNWLLQRKERAAAIVASLTAPQDEASV